MTKSGLVQCRRRRPEGEERRRPQAGEERKKKNERKMLNLSVEYEIEQGEQSCREEHDRRYERQSKQVDY